MKKFLTILKRSAALIGVAVVFICSFITPIAAVDISIDGRGETMRPLFDYDYLLLYYDDGSKACFSLKDVFFSNFMMDNRVEYILYDVYSSNRRVTFTLSDVQLEQLNINIGGQYVKLPYWVLAFDFAVDNVTNIIIGCSETIYDYDVLSTAYDSYRDSFRYYDSDGLNIPDSATFSVSNDSSFYYPVFSYSSEGSIVGRSLKAKDLSFTIPRASGKYDISPGSSVSSLADLLPSDVSNKYIYFSEFTTSFTVPDEAAFANISVFYIPVSNVVTFHQYHDAYFPEYRTDNVALDFTGWISSALSGFLNFQFAPGLRISTLLLFVLGVGAFNVFLKFFAGG